MRRMLFIAVCAIIMSLGPLFGQGTTLVGLGNVSQPPITVAPGQIITLLVSSPKTVLPDTSFQQATTLPLPTSLAGFSVSIRDNTGTHPAAILRIRQSPLCQLNRTSPDCLVTVLQIQIPFELSWSEEPASEVDLIVNDNGTQSEPFILAARSDNIHVLTTCEISGGALSNGIWAAFPPCTGLVQHSDGSVVSSNLPAKPGEVVVIYALGMGTTIPAVATGQQTPSPAPVLGAPVIGPRTVTLQFDFKPNAMPSHPYVSPSSPPPTPAFVGLTPGEVGLYQINVKIPETVPQIAPCTGPGAPLLTSASYIQTNLTIDLGGIDSFDGAAICVHPPQ